MDTLDSTVSYFRFISIDVFPNLMNYPGSPSVWITFITFVISTLWCGMILYKGWVYEYRKRNYFRGMYCFHLKASSLEIIREVAQEFRISLVGICTLYMFSMAVLYILPINWGQAPIFWVYWFGYFWKLYFQSIIYFRLFFGCVQAIGWLVHDPVYQNVSAIFLPFQIILLILLIMGCGWVSFHNPKRVAANWFQNASLATSVICTILALLGVLVHQRGRFYLNFVTQFRSANDPLIKALGNFLTYISAFAGLFLFRALWAGTYFFDWNYLQTLHSTWVQRGGNVEYYFFGAYVWLSLLEVLPVILVVNKFKEQYTSEEKPQSDEKSLTGETISLISG